MTSNLYDDWLGDITTGCTNSSAEISSKLYDQACKKSVSDSIQYVLRGDYLMKWRRTISLTRTIKKSDIDDNVIGFPTINGTAPRYKPHERYFWVSRICNTWFLRWYSNNKRSSDCNFPLCKLDLICKANEVIFNNKNNKFNGINKNLIFILSGSTSLYLSSKNSNHIDLWISGLYHIAKYARNEYSIAWIKNSPNIDIFFNNYTQIGMLFTIYSHLCMGLQRLFHSPLPSSNPTHIPLGVEPLNLRSNPTLFVLQTALLITYL